MRERAGGFYFWPQFFTLFLVVYSFFFFKPALFDVLTLHLPRRTLSLVNDRLFMAKWKNYEKIRIRWGSGSREENRNNPHHLYTTTTVGRLTRVQHIWKSRFDVMVTITVELDIHRLQPSLDVNAEESNKNHTTPRFTRSPEYFRKDGKKCVIKFWKFYVYMVQHKHSAFHLVSKAHTKRATEEWEGKIWK